MKTIIIDPGHGGTDPGAVNGSRLEKNDDLRLGLAVYEKLRACGQNALLTRNTDTYLPLNARTSFSNSNNADLFVSLHRNAAANNPAANGVEAYVSPVASGEAWSAAATILSHLVSAGVQSNRGVKTANYYVLKNAKAPAVLLETGFITNDVDNLLFDEQLDNYAEAITAGILQSLGETCIVPPPPAPPAPPTPEKERMKGIQQTLNDRYGTGLAVDGIFGAATKKALVKGLQTELNRQYGAGLAVDGIWGAKTKAAVPNVKLGAKGNITYLIQAALASKGYNINPDGVFGAKTDLAVRQFQLVNGLTPDGIVGKSTFESLFK